MRFGWVVGVLSSIEVVQASFLVLLIFTAVWALYGWPMAKVLSLPVLFLLFGVPVWSALSPLLQLITADAVFPLLRLIEIPALREEHLITLPSGQLSIEEACSGLRYFLAALTLSVLYGYLNYTRVQTRVLIVLIAGATAVVANILRVFIVIYVAYVSEMKHPLVQDHLLMGWALFGGLIFLLLMMDVALHKRRQRTVQVQVATVGSVNVQAMAPSLLPTATGRGWGVYVVALPLLAVGPGLIYLIEQNIQTVAQSKPTYLLPTVSSAWQKSPSPDEAWQPAYHGAVVQRVDYERVGQRVALYAGFYATQSQESELINELNGIVDGKTWYIVPGRSGHLQRQNGPFLEQLIQNREGRKQLVWYRYYVAGYATTNRYVAKLLQVWGSLTGSYAAAVVAIAAPVGGSEIELTRTRLEEFSVAMDWTEFAKTLH
ncbi:MAG: hypothetical protein FD130_686 [Halothiobacillaceae bacterium]|nr:MAG: hypothetical protein FD130_686 [Halothiobacillaceae bacterium]